MKSNFRSRINQITIQNSLKCVISSYTLLYKQQFYKQRQAEIDKKIKQKSRNPLTLNFCYLKIIHFLNPHYHQKIKGDILKNIQKTSASLLTRL